MKTNPRQIKYSRRYAEKKRIEKKLLRQPKITLPRTKLTFMTNMEFKEYTHKIILKQFDIVIDEAHKDFNFFLDVISRHPHIQCEPLHFLFTTPSGNYKSPTLRKNDMFRGERYRPHYRDTKGFWQSFSIAKCVSGKDTSYIAEVQQALRNEILEQVRDYRRCNPRCIVCGCSVFAMLEVDHITQFVSISKHWLDENDIPMIYKDGVRFFITDKNVSEKWQRYHKEHAELQTLCHHCHVNIRKN